MGTSAASLCEQARALLTQRNYEDAVRAVEEARLSIVNNAETSSELRTNVQETYLAVARAVLGQPQKDEVARFVTSEGKLTPRFIELLNLDNLYVEGEKIEEVAKKVRQAWKQEESTCVLFNKQEQNLRKSHELFLQMGVHSVRKNSLPWYTYCLVKIPNVQSIPHAFILLKNNWTNVQFGSIVFLLGGDLQNQIMAQRQLIQDQVDFPHPLKIMLENPVFVQGKKNINETYQKWITEKNPQPGTILCINGSPDWKSADQIVNAALLGKDMVLDTVTPNSYTPEFTRDGVIKIYQVVFRCLEAISHYNLLPAPEPKVEEKSGAEATPPPASPAKKTDEKPKTTLITARPGLFTWPRLFVGVGVLGLLYLVLRPKSVKSET